MPRFRCDAFALLSDTFLYPREDGWRCGLEYAHEGRHRLYSADGEHELTCHEWYVPKHRKGF